MAKPNRVQRTSRNKATQASRDAQAKDAAKQPVDSSVAEDTENVRATQAEDDVIAEDKATADVAEDKATAEVKETSTKKTATSKTAKSEDATDKKDKKGGKDNKSSKGEAAKTSSKRTSRSGNPAKRASGRKTSTYSSADHGKVTRPNPRWFLPVMLGILLLGLAWLIVFYISSGKWPVEAWGNWNLLVGFGIMVVGLGMSTRWR